MVGSLFFFNINKPTFQVSIAVVIMRISPHFVLEKSLPKRSSFLCRSRPQWGPLVRQEVGGTNLVRRKKTLYFSKSRQVVNK